MVSEFERLLFIKEIERLVMEHNNCSVNQVWNNIRKNILLLRKALVSMPD